MLAAETVDTIIDYLHNDKAALATCCVICRSWLPAARFHLFSEVIVESDTFLSLPSVLETSPHIGLLVRSLVVQGRDSQTRAPARRRQSSAADIVLASQLSNLTTHLSRVHSLQISCVDWELFILEDILHVLSRTLSTISRLALTRVKFRTFCHAATFICAFPTLRRLSMADVSWDANSMAAPMLTRPLVVEVSSMQIVTHARCLVDWLILQNPLPDIRTFFVQVGFDEGNDVTRRLLQSPIGPGIETLHLSLRKFTLNEPVQSEQSSTLITPHA
ncbi:hypothetical protein FIBSPDRAFT_268911 [Athelia psychrophila]|uniref:F-box domain-containing protein n=1 Tax=Athelia psychrophila TaxID=1759441 RepID=A0A166RJR7_9AGAM|nr:hypothetical protein FIBSPDRAFT_268911 [Fibularhizoctonia sp. CBS 109695]